MPLSPADLAAWRRARGRLGVQELPEAFPDAPFTLQVDFSGLAELMQRDDVANPLIGPALDALDTALRELGLLRTRQEAQPADAPPVAGLAQAEYVRQRATERWADAILSRFIVDPPYRAIADLPPGGCPPEELCYFDVLATGHLGALLDLAIGGYEALESFRQAVARAADAVPDGAGVSPVAVDDPVSDGAAAPSAVVRPGHLSGGPELGLAPAASDGPAETRAVPAPRKARHVRSVA